jgi:two-component system response regulator FixJ
LRGYQACTVAPDRSRGDEALNPQTALVAVVEDDEALRRGLSRALHAAGLETVCFPSAEAFWDGCDPSLLACIVLDLQLPGEDGLSLQQGLLERAVGTPIVFVTGHGEIETAVHAMKGGAIDFLRKPFSESELLDAVYRGLERDRGTRRQEDERGVVHQLLARLTPREREVLDLLEADLGTKAIASRLEISPRTVEVHRQRVMHKMEVDSVAALVRLMLKAAGR